MSEETGESAESGPESSTAGGIDPIAAAMALSGASREEADSFLKDQRALLGIQKHHLNEHLSEQLKQLRLGTWEKRMGVLLRIATAFMGLAIAAGLAFLIWDASQSGGLMMEPFAVPPDLAAKGLTGEVIAAKVLDRLGAMQQQTRTARAPRTYANNWDQGDLKLEIPQTGVSLSELDRFLRDKLGHNTHVSGEIVRTDKGLNLTVRAGTDGADSVPGSESDLDAMVQQAAERVYKLTQPYRYGVYLADQNRGDEAINVFKAMAQTGTTEERAWGYNGWLVFASDSITLPSIMSLYQQTKALDPENGLVLSNAAGNEVSAGRFEAALADYKQTLILEKGRSQGKIRADIIGTYILSTNSNIDRLLGAFHDGAQKRIELINAGGTPGGTSFSSGLAQLQMREHDLAAARVTLRDPLPDRTTFGRVGTYSFNLQAAKLSLDFMAEDWTSVLGDGKALDPLLTQYSALRALLPNAVTPFVAYAQAKLGNYTAAEASMANTPGDCYPCLIARGQIAAMQKQDARADYWFNLAVKSAPSIPFAYTDWGQALMRRGDLTGAIAQFKLANQKGPHFADPLEMWGEVLIAQNRSDLAIAKFTEAEKYAPNWGRLHLKWGEALLWTGKTADAQKQFARAGELDLTAAEKSELARQNHA